MGVIRELPASVVNQIAAGEVVERPASVVKELMENAIDAGATRIELTVERGGKDLVRIADNGRGMSPEDLPPAFRPHATSKLTTAEDLHQIRTLGFRGEALAAIAEVSKVTCQSRMAESSHGHELRIEGGVHSPIKPCGCPIGTVMEVRHLFFNTPVRRTFLKSDGTEAGHVNEMFSRIALAHPTIHFTFRSAGKLVYDLPAVTALKDRISLFFGKELAESLLWVEGKVEQIHLWGYVGHPTQSRSSNKAQFLFIGGRYVRDRSLSHALSEAYRGLLMVGRMPVAFLHLQIPSEEVDVNVHPTKIEVRFRDSHLIYSHLLGSIRRTFNAADLHARGDSSHAVPENSDPLSIRDPAASEDSGILGGSEHPRPNVWSSLAQPAGTIVNPIIPINSVNPSTATANRYANSSGFGDGIRARQDFSGSSLASLPASDSFLTGGRNDRQVVASWFNPSSKNANAPVYPTAPPATSADWFQEMEDAILPVTPVPKHAENENDNGATDTPSGIDESLVENTSNDASLEAAVAPRLPSPNTPLRAPGPRALQVHDSYLIVEADDGMIVIDQHALHERILFEEFKNRLEQGGMESQRLLVPLTVELGPGDSEALLEHSEVLRKLGLEIEGFGGGTILVHTLPTRLRQIQPESLVRDLAEHLRIHALPPTAPQVFVDILNMMACKAAVKAGQKLSDLEISALLERRHLVRDSHHCPHGRPTALIFTKSELEKQFGRT